MAQEWNYGWELQPNLDVTRRLNGATQASQGITQALTDQISAPVTQAAALAQSTTQGLLAPLLVSQKAGQMTFDHTAQAIDLDIANRNAALNEKLNALSGQLGPPPLQDGSSGAPMPGAYQGQPVAVPGGESAPPSPGFADFPFTGGATPYPGTVSQSGLAGGEEAGAGQMSWYVVEVP